MPLSELPPPSPLEQGNSPPLMRVRPPGPMSTAWMARLGRTESPAFGARRKLRAEASGSEMLPIVLGSGNGSNLVDLDGNMYVDLAAGFGALLLGHRPARIERALEIQANRLWMGLGDLYPSDAKVALMDKLAPLYPGKSARVLLGQSGGDAVTAALKTSKLATGRSGVIAFEGSYHGLGYGPLPLCGLRASWREAFAGQLNPHVTFAPYPAVDAESSRSLDVVSVALAKGDVGAIVIEPILGRGGCIPAPSAFLQELARMARKAGALLVADEIWTGLGRSGHMLACSGADIVPDLVCLGKGLGGGLPISACLGAADVMECWNRSPSEEVVHTATFHGAPLACATAIAMLDGLRSLRLDLRAAEVGARAIEELKRRLSDVPGVSVRGAGLMIGVVLSSGAAALALQRSLLEVGYIVTTGGMRNEVLVITPALTIDEQRLFDFAQTLRGLLAGQQST